MPWPTQVFKTSKAWFKAGSPVGGVFPAEKEGEWYVGLPGGGVWNPWQHNEGVSPWQVTGEIPGCMTASPSINAIGKYHGFLKDGVLTDDVEGRTYG